MNKARLSALSLALIVYGMLFKPHHADALDLQDACNVPLFGLIRNQNSPHLPLEDHYLIVSGTDRRDELAQGAKRDGLIPDGPADPLAHLEGVAIGYISLIPMVTHPSFGTTTPLYYVRLDDGSRRDTLYTTDYQVAEEARDLLGYDALGPDVQVLGHILARKDLKPLHRYYNLAKQDHAYVTSNDQIEALGEGYEFVATEGSVFPTSQKLPMTDALTVFCHGSSAVRNPGDERSRFYFQGEPLTPGDVQTLTFDLWTGQYFSKAPRDHLPILMWGDANLGGAGGHFGRGVVAGMAQMQRGICFEYFNGRPAPMTPPLDKTVFGCDPSSDLLLQDNRLLRFEIITTVDRIEFSVFDELGNRVARGRTNELYNVVPSGLTDVLISATNDDLEDPLDPLNPMRGFSKETSHLEIRNARVTIERPTASIHITKDPASQEINAGDPAFFTIEVTNTGAAPLTNIFVSDPQTPNCDANVASLAVGANFVYNCSQVNVMGSFTNVAQAQGNSLDGVVSDSDSAEVVVLQLDLEAAVTLVQGHSFPPTEPVMRTSLRNVGSAAATNVRARFTASSENGTASLESIPAGCELQPNPPPSRGEVLIFREEYLCEIPQLDPGEAFQLVWEDLCVTSPPSGFDDGLLFEARFLDAEQEDSDPTNDTASGAYFNANCVR